jgi:hypothetical protein
MDEIFSDEKKIGEQLRQEMQDQHDREVAIDDEISYAKGEASTDSFSGTDSATAKERRQARGEFREEDWEPALPDPIDDHVGPRSAADVHSYEDLHSFVVYKDALFRDKHPDFDSVCEKYLWPYLREWLEEDATNKQDFQRWLLENDNCAERCYEIALKERDRIRNKLPSQQEIDSMSAEEFTATLDALRNVPAKDEEPQQFVSKLEMKRMNRIANPADFAKELDRIKWSGR